MWGVVVAGGVVPNEIFARVKPATFKEAVVQLFIVAEIESFSAWSIDNFQPITYQKVQVWWRKQVVAGFYLPTKTPSLETFATIPVKLPPDTPVKTAEPSENVATPYPLSNESVPKPEAHNQFPDEEILAAKISIFPSSEILEPPKTTDLAKSPVKMADPSDRPAIPYACPEPTVLVAHCHVPDDETLATKTLSPPAVNVVSPNWCVPEKPPVTNTSSPGTVVKDAIILSSPTFMAQTQTPLELSFARNHREPEREIVPNDIVPLS